MFVNSRVIDLFCKPNLICKGFIIHEIFWFFFLILGTSIQVSNFHSEVLGVENEKLKYY